MHADPALCQSSPTTPVSINFGMPMPAWYVFCGSEIYLELTAQRLTIGFALVGLTSAVSASMPSKMKPACCARYILSISSSPQKSIPV
jgi:hypothetical protein